MPKALSASCIAGVVTVEGVPIPGAVILSEGVSSSTGYVIIDEADIYYVAKTSPDLKTTIGTVSQRFTDIANMFTAVDVQLAAMSGAGGAAVNTAALVTFNLNNTTFGLTKDNLK
jgi:hypothetical protein